MTCCLQVPTKLPETPEIKRGGSFGTCKLLYTTPRSDNIKKFAFVGFLALVGIATSEGRLLAATTVQFILGSPAPGPKPGEVYVNVEWTNAPAGAIVVVAYYQVLRDGTYIFLGSPGKAGIDANGSYVVTQGGFTSGIQLVARASIQFNGKPVAQTAFLPMPPLTVP